MAVTYGIDVSHWQGAIDWPVVGRSSLASFAAVRLTVGLKPDDRWQANLAGAANHVELPMAYSVVGTKAAQADAAELFVNLIDRVADIKAVGLVVDAENFPDGSHPTQTQIHQFRDALHRLTGRWPLAYEPDWFMTQHNYRTDGQPWAWWPSRYVPEPWGPVRLGTLWPPLEHGFRIPGPWQFTSSGIVAGISTRVDRNAYAGSLDDLRALTLGEEQDVALTTEDKAWIVDTIKTLVTVGDEPTPPGGDTHPHNLKHIRQEIAELAAFELTDTQLERLAALIAAGVQIAGHPAMTGTLRIQPEEPTP